MSAGDGMSVSEHGVCPVCNGNGLRPEGFYMQTSGTWSTASTGTEKCRSCDGRGVYEPQLRGAVEALAEAVRAHTRAIHALAGKLDYPEDERYATGTRLAALLSELRGQS